MESDNRRGKQDVTRHSSVEREAELDLYTRANNGDAVLLGTMVREGHIVDYYRIDDGKRVAYVFDERSAAEQHQS